MEPKFKNLRLDIYENIGILNNEDRLNSNSPPGYDIRFYNPNQAKGEPYNGKKIAENDETPILTQPSTSYFNGVAKLMT